MLSITITDLTGHKTVWGPSLHRTNDRTNAISMAVRKHFGPRNSFKADHGLNQGGDMTRTRYGMIGHPVGDSWSVDYGRVRIDIEEVR